MITPYRKISPHFVIENKGINLSRSVRNIYYHSDIDIPVSKFKVRVHFNNSREDATNYNLYSKIYKQLDTNDVVNLGIEKPGLMIGLIDRVRKVRSISTEKYDRDLIVEGSCFAKLLVKDSAEFTPQLIGNPRAEQIFGKERLQFLGTFARGYDGKKSQFLFNSPICALLYILKNMPAVHIDVPYTDISLDNREEGFTTLGKYLVCDLKAWMADQVVDTMLSQFHGKIWNYMEACIDKYFYEFFMDTVPVETSRGIEYRPCLFLRPKPYDRVTDPMQQVKNAAKQNTTDEKELLKNRILSKNFVIYPDITRGDIIFDNKKVEGSKINRSGENVFVTSFVSLAGLDELGLPKEDAPQFKGQRDINNPKDPNNKSMVIPWTWDGPDSFFRTMITNEPYHTITEDMIIAPDLGYDDDEVINYITLAPRKNILTQVPEAQFGYLFPLLDGGSIRKYGLRGFHAESNLIRNMSLDAGEIGAYVKEPLDSKDYFQISEIVQGRERLHCWYRYNNILESGQIQMIGNQDIRKGDKVYLPDETSKLGNRGMFAYVQKVTHSYELTSTHISYKTLLEVIRCENPKDIEYYRSQKNKKVTTTNNKKDIKFGTTYKTYDDALGVPFEGVEAFDSEGNSITPGAHNIIKFDILATDKIKEGAGNIDNINNDEIEIENTKPNIREPKKSKDIGASKDNVIKYIEKGIFTGDSGRLNDLKKGTGKPNNGPQSEVSPVVYEFLEMLGSCNFPYPIQILSIITGHNYKSRGGNVSRHSSGNALDITLSGKPSRGSKGSEDWVNKMNQLFAATVKIDSMLSVPIRQIIFCPYLDLRDKKYCKNFSSIKDNPSSESHQSDHSDHIHIGW